MPAPIDANLSRQAPACPACPYHTARLAPCVHARGLAAVPAGQAGLALVPCRVMPAQETRRGAAARELGQIPRGPPAVAEVIVRGKVMSARRPQLAVPPLRPQLVQLAAPAGIE